MHKLTPTFQGHQPRTKMKKLRGMPTRMKNRTRPPVLQPHPESLSHHRKTQVPPPPYPNHSNNHIRLQKAVNPTTSTPSLTAMPATTWSAVQRAEQEEARRARRRRKRRPAPRTARVMKRIGNSAQGRTPRADMMIVLLPPISRIHG